ncbi:hypothetical protein RI129_004257 [Pyrocoelia pectoralis]|uniref:Uncharacterized protein n=1 Tax=Pyrocoelia pectoralis TaxID=417401 RepID=A0AAN7VFI8_9COLE
MVATPRESLTKNTIESSDLFGWIVNITDENVIIKFRNGDYYEGDTSKRVMHGRGKYKWADGTIYEGNFVNGYATGHGTLQYPDLTVYSGEFCKSFLHGYGVINISSSTMRYSGNWKAGKKHGQGWLHYETDDWYDGEWFEDNKQGEGVRQYKSGETYQGCWYGGRQNGCGVFVWCNNDVYKGEWKNGKICGYGEYIWNTFINRSFTFPVENVYKGNWIDGTRNGTGTLFFGYDNGLRLDGEWVNNEKHGGGTLVCGNGTVVQQGRLFHQDQLVGETEEVPENNPTELTNRKNLLDLKSSSKKELPLHLPAENSLNLLHFNRDKMTDNYVNNSIATSGSKETLLSNLQQQQSEVERREIRDTILTNLPELYKVYNKYATIATDNVSTFKPILIRLFFWQMVRDLNYFRTNYNLIDIDLILLDNPNSGFKTRHYPFEEIFFWQFLQILLCLAWKFHTAEMVTRDCKKDGILSTLFTNFVTQVVYTSTYFTSASSLFECRDLLPFKSVYSLYKSLGEPHTARKLLCNMCIPPRQVHPSKDEKIPISQGVNGAIGGNLMYLTDDSSSLFSSNEDPYKTELFLFNGLNSKKITQCLCSICPLMKQNGVIVNIHYPLTFLEFYDTILKCSSMFIEMKRNKERRLRKMEMRRSFDTKLIKPTRRSSSKFKRLSIK